MKIKCPLCGCENYFTGLEDEGTKFCSECNTPLVEPKIPDNIENPYIKKEKTDNDFTGLKKMLDKETFCPYCGIELIEKYKGKYKCPSCNRSFCIIGDGSLFDNPQLALTKKRIETH